MPASTVIVSHRDGSPARHVKVVLGFSGGMSRPGFTDSAGQATVDHESRGTATIYVSGKRVGTFRAPGRTAVTV